MQFVDLQIAGYAGVNLLDETPSVDEFTRFADRLATDGVARILLTVVSDDLDRLCARIVGLRRLIDSNPAWRKLMPGFHVEGPCISPREGYRGAHPLKSIQPATVDLFKRLQEACGGPGRLAMVTLAPEEDAGLRSTRWLVEQNVAVAAGHTDASLDTLREAERAGVRFFTHLGNGCAKLVDRHDNILHRALALERVSYTMIADGHHVPWFLLRQWIRYVGVERCIFISDAVSPAAAPAGRYRVLDMEVEIGPERKVTLPGTPYLAGSALTMPEAYHNAMTRLGLSDAEALAVTRDNPTRAMGWSS